MGRQQQQIFKYQNADNESPIPFPNEDRPLAILFGWMGCKPQQLSKYGDQWRKRGCNTFSFCSKPIQLLIPGIIKSKGNEMLEQIKIYLKENKECKSIIFNAMSNGGGFYYAHIINQIHEKPENKWLIPYIKGTTLDSLPAIRPLSIYTAFRMTSPNMVVAFLLALIVPIIVIFYGPYMNKYKRSLSSPKNNWQHLVFYSKTDIIVHSDDIDELVSEIKNNLSNKEMIDYKCFEDSPHVLHLRQYPTIYEEKLNHFIDSIKRQQIKNK